MSARVLAIGIAWIGMASAQSGPPQGVYACNALSFGRQILARQLKLWSNGAYEHIPIGAAGRSDWGTPGTGRFVSAGNGAPTFQGGPLAGAKVDGYSFDGKSARFNLQGPADPRATSCFGPAYHVDLK